MGKQYRHGDIFLNEIDVLPEGAKKTADKRLVLALGETTGHAHVLTGTDVKMWESNKQEFVTVEKGDAKLTHEEHGVIPVEDGVYQVIHQREYTPKAIRQVRD